MKIGSVPHIYIIEMSSVMNAWLRLNQDAQRVCQEAVGRMLTHETRDEFVNICRAFLHKGTEILQAVNTLYAQHLEEPAQALIRILFELRINFDCFITMASQDTKNTVIRVIDSMLLEKVKQARTSGFVGLPAEFKRILEEDEQEMASRYTEKEFKRLRKYGFTGLPIEQRASLTGHEEAYNVVYRNFSRNIHSTDYVESYMKIGLYSTSMDKEYIESRDSIAQYTAHFSAVGMMEFANGLFGLNLDKELDDLGKRQQQIKEGKKVE